MPWAPLVQWCVDAACCTTLMREELRDDSPFCHTPPRPKATKEAGTVVLPTIETSSSTQWATPQERALGTPLAFTLGTPTSDIPTIASSSTPNFGSSCHSLNSLVHCGPELLSDCSSPVPNASSNTRRALASVEPELASPPWTPTHPSLPWTPESQEGEASGQPVASTDDTPEWLRHADMALEGHHDLGVSSPIDDEEPEWLRGAQKSLDARRSPRGAVTPPSSSEARCSEARCSEASASEEKLVATAAAVEARAELLLMELERVRAEHAALLAAQGRGVLGEHHYHRTTTTSLLRSTTRVPPTEHHASTSPLAAKEASLEAASTEVVGADDRAGEEERAGVLEGAEEERGLLELVSVRDGEGAPLTERLLQVVGAGISLMDVENGELVCHWEARRMGAIVRVSRAILIELRPLPTAGSTRHRQNWLRRLSFGAPRDGVGPALPIPQAAATTADTVEMDPGTCMPCDKLHLVFATVERASELCLLLEAAKRGGGATATPLQGHLRHHA